MTAGTINHDLLYNPRLTVADAAATLERWQAESAVVRARSDCYLDVPYGAGDSESMDIFRAEGPSRATLLFIHGGYWRSRSKSDFSFLASAFTRAGVTVAIPGYSLCPAVEVSDIVMQMVQATSWLYRNGANFGAPQGQLHVAGHSAGGHLAAMLLACVWPAYAADLPVKVVQAALSIAGLYDLADIVKAPSINDDVRLTNRSAALVSPAYLPPASDATLYTAVGADEIEGFHIQNRVIAQRWKQVLREDISCPGDNHFTVLDRFASSGSPLFNATLRMLGI